jgi:hypothetical protein
VRLDNRAADRQPHAHAARLGGKEGVEEMLETLGGEPDARILHRHNHAI